MKTMKSKLLLIIIFFLISLGLSVQDAFATSQDDGSGQPNIILIVADDMGYGDVGAYGADKINTPNMDQLAEGGIRFTDAHSASALCSPSRYSILTGRYPWRTELKQSVLTPFEDPLIGEDRLTVASLLKDAGYYTAAIGKWHLGFDWPVKEGRSLSEENAWSLSEQEKVDFSKPLSGGPLDRGFDNYYGIPGSNNMFPYVIIEDHRVTQEPSVDKVSYDTDWEDAQRAPNWSTKKMGADMTEQATAYIHDHFREDPGQPMFLYFAATSVHRPCVPNHTKGWSDAGLRGDLVAEFDWSVGRVVEALKKNGEFENSLIIVTSDNGPRPGDPMQWISELQGRYYGHEMLPKDYLSGEYQPRLPFHKSNYGGPWMTYGHDASGKFLGFKDDAWEGGHRVPFIVHWPGGIEEPGVSGATLSQSDLLATLAALTGQSLPDDAGEDSYNMLPAFKDHSVRNIRNAMVNASGWGSLAIREGKWKLIDKQEVPSPETQYPSKLDTGPELYNMNEDPYEENNVFEQHPDVVKKLRSLLSRYREQGHSAPRLE